MDCVPQASRVVPLWLIERGPDPISIAMAIGSGSVRLELALLLLILGPIDLFYRRPPPMCNGR